MDQPGLWVFVSPCIVDECINLYLVGEEPVLTLLTVERWAVVDHLWVDLHLVDQVHVVAKLLQVLRSNRKMPSLRMVARCLNYQVVVKIYIYNTVIFPNNDMSL